MDMTIRFPGGARVDAEFNGLKVSTDQPRGAGGDCTAPTPFATFLASIGTCAGIYVLGFCQQRGLSTEGITLTQHTHSDPVTHLIKDIELDIHVPASFPAKYHEALVRSAAQCTVKKHLEHPPAFQLHTVVDA